MQKIKVAEFVTRLEFGGVEAMILNYISHFSNKEIFDFHIVTQDINNNECISLFRDQGFTVHIVTHKRKSILKNVIEINSVLKKEKFDIVHCHMTLMNFYVLFLAWCHGVKVRISHSHNAFVSNNLVKIVFWRLIKQLNKIMSNIWIACGIDAGKFLYGEKALNSSKVIILKNAIDIEKYAYSLPKREKIRKKYYIDNDSFCVGHIGRFSEQKNHHFLLDVFEEILKSKPKSKLLLIGSGEGEKEIKETVKRKGLSDTVFFVGSATNTSDFYQAMDIFVLPSLFEGLPLVLVEAQASDLPCIVASTVDKRSRIKDDFLFLSLDDDKCYWAKMALTFANHVRTNDEISKITNAGYSIENEAIKLQNLYLSAMRNG